MTKTKAAGIRRPWFCAIRSDSAPARQRPGRGKRADEKGSELGQGGLVGYQGEVLVELEDGGGDPGSDRAGEGLLHDTGLLSPETTMTTRSACMMSQMPMV